MDEKITQKFRELIALGNRVVDSAFQYDEFTRGIDSGLAREWEVSTSSLLYRVAGPDSVHFRIFSQHLGFELSSDAERALGVLRAAFTDFQGGFLFNIREKLRAEVFDDFLEQGDYLFSEGYFQVAAVIAGAVLEDSLRKLCAKHAVTLPTKPALDLMNSELMKKAVYDRLMLKRITLLADIRNKAAHGKWSEFTAEDSRQMLEDVRRFIERYPA